MLFINLALYVFAFILIWFGSGLIVASASRFSQRLRISSFAFSFVFLGLFTSVPEFSVGLQAIADHDPEIFVGNLIGGIPVLFLLVIPVLAILGKGINLKHELNIHTLAITLGVILAPSIAVLDKKVTNIEGVILIVLYLVLIFLVERKHGIFDNGNGELLDVKSYSYKDILKILAGVAIIFVSSSIIVDKTIYFANIFNISAFYVGLIIVALGTNMPEMSIAIRSVIEGKRDVAMGDYLGSASANTLLFGIFTVLNNGEVVTVDNFLITLIFIATALMVFFVLSYKYRFISRTSGFILLCAYFLFLAAELVGQ
ncbi:MAG: sodium:calcium antiporter [Candidatus Levybacteria bacterium]|nr:sodium:calcium antiporter [Candidatus Levybacteria bacterium]